MRLIAMAPGKKEALEMAREVQLKPENEQHKRQREILREI